MRKAYADGLRDAVADIAGLAGPEVSEDEAIADLATLVGAMVLARATSSDEISERILKAVSPPSRRLTSRGNRYVVAPSRVASPA